MKNKLKYFAVIVLFLTLGACKEEFLDTPPQDSITSDNFYKTEADVRANTASLYGMPWFEFNDKFSWCAGDLMAGDIFHDWDQEGQFMFLTFNAGNAIISQGWNGLYRVVSYANSIINDMPRAASGNVTEDVINRALGEARFVRAMTYYLLVEFWGEVPIVENSTELVTSNNMMLPKNTRSSIYEFMKRDLEFAAANLPATDVPGRVTQWSAKGLLAKLHLTIAQGTKAAEDYDKAKAYALDVITNSGLSLMTNYGDLFKIENNNNPETLFALQWITQGWGYGNSRQAVFARSSVITQNTQAWGGGKSVTYDFILDVEPGDRRRPHIYMRLGDYYPEINKANGGYTYNIVSLDDEGNQLEGAAPMLNNLKKYVIGSSDDSPGVGTNQDVSINEYLLRLADVYLIYTEAVLGSGTSTTDAKALEYLNAIRSRAGLPPKSSVSYMDILKERRIEFGIESMNWFDIKRFYYRDPQAAIAYLNAQERAYRYTRLTGDNIPDENTMEGYELTPPSSPVVIYELDMFLPIPSGEVGDNPLLAPEEPAVDYYASQE
ncbi:MAG: RagB/SusD family nutrient uptake outer membrane protein [Mangrovibacterium sp.]